MNGEVLVSNKVKGGSTTCCMDQVSFAFFYSFSMESVSLVLIGSCYMLHVKAFKNISNANSMLEDQFLYKLNLELPLRAKPW